jgi:DNA repair protein RadC
VLLAPRRCRPSTQRQHRLEREVLFCDHAVKAAVLANAAAVIFAHNHPSGDPSPSPDDHDITRRLAEAGEILGIEVLDHIIVGDGRTHSFRAAGALQ